VRQAAPDGRVLGRLCDGLGKLAVFEAARSRSYAKLVCKKFSSGRFVFLTDAVRLRRCREFGNAFSGGEKVRVALAVRHLTPVPLPDRGGEGEKNGSTESRPTKADAPAVRPYQKFAVIRVIRVKDFVPFCGQTHHWLEFKPGSRHFGQSL
jgi:hypothetical protein